MSAVPTPSVPDPLQRSQDSPYAPPSAPVDRDGVEVGEIPAAYAGFWMRFCAAFLDGILLTVVLFLVSFVAGMVAAFTPGASAEYVATLTVLFAIVASWLYYALLESSGYQATLGKRALKLWVATQHDHARISFARATARYFAHFLSVATFYLGYLIQPFTARKQALHDLVSGTVVLSTGPASSALVVVLVVLILFVPGLGILAAIALPAYGDRTIRAQVSEGLALGTSVRTAAAEYYLNEEKFAPDMAALNYPNGVSGHYVSAVTVRDGGIDVEFGNRANPKIAGKHLGIQMLVDPGGNIIFLCGGAAAPAGFQPAAASGQPATDVPAKYLPANCRRPRGG